MNLPCRYFSIDNGDVNQNIILSDKHIPLNLKNRDIYAFVVVKHFHFWEFYANDGPNVHGSLKPTSFFHTTGREYSREQNRYQTSNDLYIIFHVLA